MTVNGDIVFVEGWQFVIDRTVLKIGQELGNLTKEEMLKPTIIKTDVLSVETWNNNINQTKK